ncbi:MAG: DegT/DnrJ/EryC1/StrS family aminotransferase, partial [Ignavibacteriae bacterium]|nr:DegT/DnrJ/EryC1/StrS family aminotransferase [Ignavibacteriota bacterium]
IPSFEDFIEHARDVFESAWLTNNGPKLQLLDKQLKEYLGSNNITIVSNGTIAIQILLRAMEVKDEVITTPYSYVATTSALLWEKCIPVFADIDPYTFCIDPEKVEQCITEKTTAILATNVYGRPCDVEGLEAIAERYNLKLIFDAAQAFGAKYKSRSVLTLGDGATSSFHATKVFNTAEGGSIYFKDPALEEKIELLRSFGHKDDDHYVLGINGKMSELHAIMGLIVLPHINDIIAKRKLLTEAYHERLPNHIISNPNIEGWENNYSYYPILAKNNNQREALISALIDKKIKPRRYFYPSLDQLPYLPDSCNKKMPISIDIASRVLCLPLYYDLKIDEIDLISDIVKKIINEG